MSFSLQTNTIPGIWQPQGYRIFYKYIPCTMFTPQIILLLSPYKPGSNFQRVPYKSAENLIAEGDFKEIRQMSPLVMLYVTFLPHIQERCPCSRDYIHCFYLYSMFPLVCFLLIRHSYYSQFSFDSLGMRLPFLNNINVFWYMDVCKLLENHLIFILRQNYYFLEIPMLLYLTKTIFRYLKCPRLFRSTLESCQVPPAKRKTAAYHSDF